MSKKDRLDPMAVNDPGRRRFLQILGVGVAAPAILRMTAACGDDGGSNDKPIVDGASYFPQSIASGDPRTDSVVLWARIIDPARGTDDLDATLLVATDEAFEDVVAEQALTAANAHDHIVKLLVKGLDADTRYYYRFVYEADDGTRFGSRIGRTKTAVPADSAVPVKLALASCQDFIGRYYHSYAKMLELADELDVVVHIGDYVYETTGDPTFQSEGTVDRQVVFSDTDGAIPFRNDKGEITNYAAQSLSNYRELYRTYRSDTWLQAVHEKVPFVFIWDDHEFSDDCYGDNATYFDGKRDESNQLARRSVAEKANFEYLPTEQGLDTSGALTFGDDEVPVKDADVVIYKDLRFGKHVHLVLTDTRSYRPDHAIPEDSVYGQVVMTEDELTANGVDPTEKSGNDFVYAPYIDLGRAENAGYRDAVRAGLLAAYEVELPGDADNAARADKAAVGLFSAVAVNKLAEAQITGGTLGALDVSETTELPRGATYDNLRFSKGQLFSANGLGARYLVEKKHHDLLQKVRYAKDERAQDLFGAKQEAWLRQTISGSNATWKLVASSISTASMIIDVSDDAYPPSLEGIADTPNIKAGLGLFKSLLHSPYYLSVDQWDGFPDKRAELHALLRSTPGAILLSGDIHSFYVTDHGKGEGANPLFEVTGGGISSESFKGFVRGAVDGLVPGISQTPTVGAVISHLEAFLQETFPEMVFANNDAVGFVTLTCDADKADITLFAAPLAHVAVKTEDQAAAVAPFTTTTYRITGGAMTKVS